MHYQHRNIRRVARARRKTVYDALARVNRKTISLSFAVEGVPVRTTCPRDGEWATGQVATAGDRRVATLPPARVTICVRKCDCRDVIALASKVGCVATMLWEQSLAPEANDKGERFNRPLGSGQGIRFLDLSGQEDAIRYVCNSQYAIEFTRSQANPAGGVAQLAPKQRENGPNHLSADATYRLAEDTLGTETAQRIKKERKD